MRIPSHPIAALSLGFLFATLAVPAAAGSFYAYETDDGGIAFTDDAKRIPAAYRDDARVIERDGFDDFDRYTHVGQGREAASEARTDERLAYLRDLNARQISPDAVGAPLAPGPGGFAIRSGRDGQSVDSYVDPRNGGEPIVVERVRSRPDGSPVTRHVTIVRQGDRVLSIYAPEQRHGSTSFVDERELFDAID
jgi:hypothetical protein